jgi:hypothetical protein
MTGSVPVIFAAVKAQTAGASHLPISGMAAGRPEPLSRPYAALPATARKENVFRIPLARHLKIRNPLGVRIRNSNIFNRLRGSRDRVVILARKLTERPGVDRRPLAAPRKRTSRLNRRTFPSPVTTQKKAAEATYTHSKWFLTNGGRSNVRARRRARLGRGKALSAAKPPPRSVD